MIDDLLLLIADLFALDMYFYLLR